MRQSARGTVHEYSIVCSLLDRVEAEARSHGASSVSRIRVRIGELSGVESDLLVAAFEMARAGSVSEAAALDVVPVAAAWACPGCGRRLAPGDILRCPDCRLPARLDAGDEIILERIEMEVA